MIELIHHHGLNHQRYYQLLIKFGMKTIKIADWMDTDKKGYGGELSST